MKKLIAITALLAICCGSAFAGWSPWNWSFKWGQGQGVAQYVDLLPVLSWSPSTFTFANTSTGRTRSQIVTLSNTGNDTAEQIQASITGGGSSVFSIYSTQITVLSNLSSARLRQCFPKTGSRTVYSMVLQLVVVNFFRHLDQFFRVPSMKVFVGFQRFRGGIRLFAVSVLSGKTFSRARMTSIMEAIVKVRALRVGLLIALQHALQLTLAAPVFAFRCHTQSVKPRLIFFPRLRIRPDTARA